MAGPKALLAPSERKELRRAERKQRLEYLRDELLFESVQTLKLKKYMFLSDEELKTVHFLKPRQIAKVRAWEQAKRDVPYGVESSQRIFETLMRAEGEKKQLNINVENLSIQLPEKQQETIEAVVIEVDAGDNK